MKNKINHGLIGIIVMLVVLVLIISFYKVQPTNYEDVQDMTQEEVMNYLSHSHDVEEALSECGLTIDSLNWENVTIKYIQPSDLWEIKIPIAKWPDGTTAKDVSIHMDDNNQILSAECMSYK